MTETKHMPWTTLALNEGIAIKNADNITVAYCDYDLDHNDTQDNADLIVRACNSHSDLMEVVEAMSTFDGRNFTGHLRDMAKAALAKAKGEQASR